MERQRKERRLKNERSRLDGGRPAAGGLGSSVFPRGCSLPSLPVGRLGYPRGKGGRRGSGRVGNYAITPVNGWWLWMWYNTKSKYIT